MASDPLPFNLHDQLEPLECNSRQTRRGSASPQSAHTSSCFAGDVGGYLGLLIGGSVLTIIEVVDLVFYNSLMRCCGRR